MEEEAEKLARYIFSLGDKENIPTQRMQFMGGSYPDKEKPQGGLCETALAEVIKNYFKSKPV